MKLEILNEYITGSGTYLLKQKSLSVPLAWPLTLKLLPNILLFFFLSSLFWKTLLISILISPCLLKNRMTTQKTEMAVTSLIELVIGSHFLSANFSSFQSSQKESCNLCEERVVI